MEDMGHAVGGKADIAFNTKACGGSRFEGREAVLRDMSTVQPAMHIGPRCQPAACAGHHRHD
jgi:hypothetical protein